MSDETILIGNILASIFQPIYYCLFMTFTKNIKENRIKFILLTILDYIFIQNIVHFRLGVNADLLYAIAFYVNLKLLYKEKARVTDLITFIISDVFLGVISVLIYFVFKMNIFSLILVLIIPIIIVVLLRNKLKTIDNFYNKYWNRHNKKRKIKSITVRGFSLCITVFEFLALHFWMLYLLLK